MRILFVNNHLDALTEALTICQNKNAIFGGAILNGNLELANHYSYAISPVEHTHQYIKSLFNQFDEIIFLKDHKNYVVRIHQSELESLLIPTKQVKLKLEKKIIFFGCSHTFGSGHLSKSTTYPYILSNLLDMDYVNLGLPGKGNYEIEDLMNQYQFKNNIIILQFTDMYRIRYKFNNNIVSESPYHIDAKTHNKELLGEENLFFNFQKLSTRIVNRLIEGNNKFLITFVCNFENEYDLKCLEHLQTFKEFASNVGTVVDVASDNAHYGALSHKLWAEKLYNKWISLYEKSEEN